MKTGLLTIFISIACFFYLLSTDIGLENYSSIKDGIKESKNFNSSKELDMLNEYTETSLSDNFISWYEAYKITSLYNDAVIADKAISIKNEL